MKPTFYKGRGKPRQTDAYKMIGEKKVYLTERDYDRELLASTRTGSTPSYPDADAKWDWAIILVCVALPAWIIIRWIIG